MNNSTVEMIQRCLPHDWQVWRDPYADQIICRHMDSLKAFIITGEDFLELGNEVHIRNLVQARLDLEVEAEKR